MGQDRKLDLKVPSFEWSFFFLSLFLFVVGSPYIRSQITTQTKLYTKGIHARVYIQPPLLSFLWCLEDGIRVEKTRSRLLICYESYSSLLKYKAFFFYFSLWSRPLLSNEIAFRRHV